ncbi:stage II sporulation protein P [Paenibacillus wynnii]|uniref:Stage II sporulation protein P n=1 Tax=Paenibacillus wynnii TaxID=268407 RepID=A0A098M6L4_9BACL|nr:stage II sporulation protein P [Paenibacillus wynnii]KGE18214.1 stage II sporulation protein P [Paenibacillus wynnii]
MNKKWFQLWNIGRLRARFMDVLSLGKTMLLLAGGSFVFFILLGAGGLAGQKLNSSPIPSMKGLATSLSSGFFMEILGMEMPHLPKGKEFSALSGDKVTSFVFQLLTSVNPNDPKSLLSRELPGLAADEPVLLRNASGGSEDAPADYHPGTDELTMEEGTVTPDDPSLNEGGDEPEATPVPQPTASPDTAGSKAQDLLEKRILIYHSHPREAYNPLIGTNGDNPSSALPSKNVMLVGSYLSKRLELRGVGTIHSKEDYATEVEDYSWNFSYKYSRQMIKTAFAQNDGLNELIDIHRDSQRHKKTTTVIDGKSYAQVYFILGHANKDWKKNEAFANQIHQLLEKEYPGISRGIWGKAANKGNNGEYNQSLSPNSVLIEVGGIDNTAEELKRTSEILGDAIADVYWSSHEAEKVNAASKSTDSDATKGKALEGTAGDAS